MAFRRGHGEGSIYASPKAWQTRSRTWQASRCGDANMTQVDAGGILDMALAGTSATLLARKWESALLVNVDNDTLRKILANPEAFEAVMKIEGFRALGSAVFETVINKSEKVSATKKEKAEGITPKE